MTTLVVILILGAVLWFVLGSNKSKEPSKNETPMYTVGVPEDEWLDWMLDELEWQDYQEKYKKEHGYYPDPPY
jgi:hypothetical protein